MAYLDGIDVSHYQVTTPSLAGLSFLFAKATEGTGYVDPMYATHIANARKAGLITGAYHFNGGGTPEAQAQFFVTTAGTVDFLFLDVEGVGAFDAAESDRFIAEVHRLGRKCGLYMSESVYQWNVGQDYDWIAHYGTTVWPKGAEFWQYRGSPLDLDHFNGDLAALQALGGVMAPHIKPAGPLIGTATIAGTGHYLVNTENTATRYGPRPAGELLSVLASVNLVDAKGVPIDIDGKQPPVGNRNQVYLVDKTEFGADCYILRADVTFTSTDPAALAAAELKGRQAEWDRQNANATAKVVLAPRPT